MAQDSPPRRGSVVGPVLFICIGVLFLIAELRPSFDPWPILWTYWPLLLIFVGLGKMYDYWQRREHPDAPRGGTGIGTLVGLIVFMVLFIGLATRGSVRAGHFRTGKGYAMQHLSRSVDRQDAKTVHATIEMGAGELNLSGGSSHLLEADFDYRTVAGPPSVDYAVRKSTGELNISQNEDNQYRFHTTSDNRWTLHLANDVPLDVRVDMGAGRGNLRLRDIAVTRLSLNMGAGQVDLDLTGDRKSDLTADVEGGVGTADIRLPRNIGVIVNASGGIGTIDAQGLHHDGDQYTNDAYGKTPVTIHLRVEGGVGRISLREE